MVLLQPHWTGLLPALKRGVVAIVEVKYDLGSSKVTQKVDVGGEARGGATLGEIPSWSTPTILSVPRERNVGVSPEAAMRCCINYRRASLCKRLGSYSKWVRGSHGSPYCRWFSNAPSRCPFSGFLHLNRVEVIVRCINVALLCSRSASRVTQGLQAPWAGN